MLHVVKFTFNPYQENTYLVYDEEKSAIIIDPGCYEQAERDTLEDFIRNEGLNPVKLINTHCHIDHVLGNAFIARTYNLKLEAHKEEIPVLAPVTEYGAAMGITVDPSPDIEIFLEEGKNVLLGEHSLQVLFTPGHSPGSVCLYSESGGFLIGGDVLFQMSIGRTDLPGGDYQTLINSIEQKLFKLPAETIVHPGHGPATNIGFEQENNPFFKT